MNSINRPNFDYNYSKYKKLGDNNLRRSFVDCFNILLSSCYNDNTKGSRFYNKFNDGKSRYYVEQPEIEHELEVFKNSLDENDTFLVGFTGIGKTSLLKNYFNIENSNPFIDEEKNLIAYLSVHSDDLECANDIDEVLVDYQKSIVKCLNNLYAFELNTESSINEFYSYISNNKNRLLDDWDPFEGKADKKQVLKAFLEEHPVQFYSVFIKFLLMKINYRDTKINNLIMIFDDIESQCKDVHIPFISKILNISSCLRNTLEERHCSIKSLIALRAYTFRYHKSRQTQAKRIYEENVILKSTIPAMKDIFKKRFEVYHDNLDVQSKIQDENRWSESTEVLMNVVNNLGDFGDMISSIAHYDIAHSFRLFLKIITNHRWFAPNESYYKGAFPIPDSDNYVFSIRERVFNALFYGEDEVFIDNNENILPNILRIHSEENPDEELLTLYVLEHMKVLERNRKVSLYGVNKISGVDLCGKISNVFNADELLTKKIEHAISFLYINEYLLHSIFEPEEDDINTDGEHFREYDPDYGLYLSIRGNKILEMFENDSMLFEIFRDDIDTTIENNTVISTKLNRKEKMVYLIDYCGLLFEKEKNYIANSNKLDYFKLFNNRFIITRLLTGIKKSFTYYYRKQDENAMFVRKKLLDMFNEIIQYKNKLESTNKELVGIIDVSFIDLNI